MEAKQKALELFNKYYQLVADGAYPTNNAKRCALICVDETLELQLELSHDDNLHNIDVYYKEVKKEIEKL